MPTENQVTESRTIIEVPRTKLWPCAFNPRKNFPPEKLDEMGESLRGPSGCIMPLIARRIEYRWEHAEITNGMVMEWRVADRPWRSIHHDFTFDPVIPGYKSPLLTSENCEEVRAQLPDFEIVEGECRWRSADERKHSITGEVMPALETLPVLLREMSDAETLIVMLIANGQRNDLTELEESAAFGLALDEKDGEGQPLYTVRAFASKIGRSESYVKARLNLRRLDEIGRKALLEGRLPYRTARTIAGYPASVIPLLTDETLNPGKYGHWDLSGESAVLSAEDVAEVAREKYVRDLRSAPFDIADPNIVPEHVDDAGERAEGGSCNTCPWNTAVQHAGTEEKKSRSGKAKGGSARGDVAAKACLNPGCYRKKVEVNAAAELVKAKDEGCKVLSEAETEEIMKNGSAAKYVRIDEKPEPDLLAPGITEKKAPTWGKMIEGESKPPVLAFVDKAGNVQRLVERKLAVAAAQKNGTEKVLNLAAGRGRSVQEEDEASKRKKEQEAQKLKVATSRAIVGALVAHFSAHGIIDGFWEAALPLAIRHAGSDGCKYVTKRRQIDQGSDVYAAALKAGEALSGGELRGYVFELLLAQDLAWTLSPNCTTPAEHLSTTAKDFLKLYGVDVKAISARVKAEAKEGKNVQRSTSNTQHSTGEAESIRDVFGKMARLRKMSLESIDGICTEVAGKPYVALGDEELHAVTRALSSKVACVVKVAGKNVEVMNTDGWTLWEALSDSQKSFLELKVPEACKQKEKTQFLITEGKVFTLPIEEAAASEPGEEPEEPTKPKRKKKEAAPEAAPEAASPPAAAPETASADLAASEVASQGSAPETTMEAPEQMPSVEAEQIKEVAALLVAGERVKIATVQKRYRLGYQAAKRVFEAAGALVVEGGAK
jgi:ParB-like chromosome segregation protein Spo0J